MIDINELRQLAQAASHPTTKGRWIRLFGERTVYDRMEDGCRGIPVVSTDTHPPSPSEAACLDFIAAANPAAINELLDRLEAAEEERDALRAKVEAMERQEPVAWCATDETGTVIEALGMNQSRRFDTALYLAPGAQAQPAPSMPDLLESLRCACNYIDKLGGVSQQYRAMLASPEAKP